MPEASDFICIGFLICLVVPYPVKVGPIPNPAGSSKDLKVGRSGLLLGSRENRNSPGYADEMRQRLLSQASWQ